MPEERELHISVLSLKGWEFLIRNKPLTRARSGVPYTEQSPKTKENDVIMILSSLAYITPIRLLFCISTMRRSLLDIGREREREFSLKKKKDYKIGQK